MKRKGNQIIFGLLIIILIVGVILIFKSDRERADFEKSGAEIPKSLNIHNQGNEDAEGFNSKENSESKSSETYIIEISVNGFHPEVLEINQGDRVIFLNRDDALHWPASDVHPTHRNYPGSDIRKCSSSIERIKIFDACHGLIQGERFEIVLNEEGSWRFHDHLSAGLSGTIIVN